MNQATLYTADGKKSGSVDLPDRLFSLPWAEALVHQASVSLAANQRSGTSHTKGRSEVRGGGRKPWRQKGTGRARHGSIRSPLWVGGGVTFGPNRAKNYQKSLTRKMRAKAFFTVLSEKLRDNSLAFVEPVSLERPSTKSAAALVEALCGESGDKKRSVCTIVLAKTDDPVRRSFSNIRGVSTVAIDALNIRDALSAKKLFFMDPDETVRRLEARGSSLPASGS